MTPLDLPAATIAGEQAILGGPSGPVSRVTLDRPRIVAAAVAYIDESGLASLTMRRLGLLMGVEAMSLYSYIQGKEDLLDAIVEFLIRDMHADNAVLYEPDRGWQDLLQRTAHSVRRVALAHPKAFPLVAARPPEAPWLRPPLSDLEWVEAFLSGLQNAGFADVAAVAGYRAFTSFLLGHLLLEVSALGADVGPLDVVEERTRASENLPEHPTVRRLHHALAQDHATSEFEEALEELLNRISRIAAETA